MESGTGAGEDREGLAGVAHDKGGLGVGVACLMEEFDGGHLAAALGLLEAVGEDDEAALGAFDSRMDAYHEASPELGELVDTESGL